MTHKPANEIAVGDLIETDDGPKAVTAVHRGLYERSRLIQWRGGEGHIFFGESVELAREKT